MFWRQINVARDHFSTTNQIYVELKTDDGDDDDDVTTT